MEALELLYSTRYSTTARIYFAFGHDGKKAGGEGAKPLRNILQEENMRFEFVLVLKAVLSLMGLFPGPEQPVALGALAEKGYVSTFT